MRRPLDTSVRVLISAILWLSLAAASASEATIRFEEAVRFDDEGHAKLAFASYRRAAEAGLPSAEFNVAVMLDSGRGVEQDVTQAATWYARAASHGNPRAAYNLGQLYETGQGVPLNVDLARAWFEASRLPAARGRAAALISRASAGTDLSAPIPTAPADRATTYSEDDGVEIVWTARQQPEPVRYFVEVHALTSSSSREIFAGFAETSSIFVPLPTMGGTYAWRVSVVAPQISRYAPSAWSRFSVANK